MNTTLRSLVTQLLMTELFSLLFFWRDLFVGFMAPLGLVCCPLWSIQDRDCRAFLECGGIDAIVFFVLVLSIRKNYKTLGCICLLLFNVTSVLLTLASW